VRQGLVVITSPRSDYRLSVSGIAEVFVVQTLVAKFSVATLDIGVLRGFACGDELQVHTLLIGPAIQRPAGELGPLVGANGLGPSASPLAASLVGLAFYAESQLEYSYIQVRLGQQLLQLRVLRFELTQPLRFIDLRSAEFRTPLVERGVAKCMLAAQLLDRHTGLGVRPKPDRLLLRKPLLQVRFSFRNGLY